MSRYRDTLNPLVQNRSLLRPWQYTPWWPGKNPDPAPCPCCKPACPTSRVNLLLTQPRALDEACLPDVSAHWGLAIVIPFPNACRVNLLATWNSKFSKPVYLVGVPMVLAAKHSGAYISKHNSKTPYGECQVTGKVYSPFNTCSPIKKAFKIRTTLPFFIATQLNIHLTEFPFLIILTTVLIFGSSRLW